MDINDLSIDFWMMVIADHLAERTPTTRSCDLDLCQRLAKEYLAAHPTALSTAIESVGGKFHLDRVIERLEPALVPWARGTIPDLLDRPAGMY
jgi:hypothetical protein